MKRVVAGDCSRENVYELHDPADFVEAQFEVEVVKALRCLMPDYHCGVYAGSYELEGDRRCADLALVHRSLSHWFVVEVELDTHSLAEHVLPQVRCFRYGKPDASCVASLRRAFPFFSAREAEAVLDLVPREVAVITNRAPSNWAGELSALNVQLLSLAVLRNAYGGTAYELEGRLVAYKESLGFGTYLATDKAVILPKTCGLPDGELQIQDPYDVTSTWVVRKSPTQLWLSKAAGFCPIPHNARVQILRTHTGSVSLRLST